MVDGMRERGVYTKRMGYFCNAVRRERFCVSSAGIPRQRQRPRLLVGNITFCIIRVVRESL